MIHDYEEAISGDIISTFKHSDPEFVELGVAIARDGRLVHYKAYGQLDPAKATPMPLDAIFALASMTKPMAAVAGLTLMEQGRLPLQAKLADYFPAFADMKAIARQLA